ncbi:MAG: M20 family metallopeptidase [Haloarculaceae archaeon]
MTHGTNTDAAEYPTDLASLAAVLVRIETENPPGNERPAAEYVHEWFTHHGIDATLLADPDPDRPQVGARVGDGGPTLVLNGHTDVVPAGDHGEWSHPPYGGVIEDGRLYGRGSVDMKTGIAVAMLTALELADSIESGELPGSLVVHAAMGEETAAPGTRALLEAGFDGDFGVVLEPTECRVATSAKGLAWYELGWPGEPSHASRPDQGHNAIGEVGPVLAAIDAYDERLRERTDPLCGRGYATVTRVIAGRDTNRAVLPGRASLVLDRRILPGETVRAVDEEVAELVEGIEREHGIPVTWERTETYAPASIPTDHPLAETFREHAATVAGAPTEPWGIEASTDVRNFVNDAGIPAITWGPGRLEQAHTVDEYVDLAAAEAGMEALRRAATDLLSADG